jgi:hypothetical protein
MAGLREKARAGTPKWCAQRAGAAADAETVAGARPAERAPRADPWAGLPRRTCADVYALAAEQGVSPVAEIADLGGDFWPAEESADDFTATIRAWRNEDDA